MVKCPYHSVPVLYADAAHVYEDVAGGGELGFRFLSGARLVGGLVREDVGFVACNDAVSAHEREVCDPLWDLVVRPQAEKDVRRAVFVQLLQGVK